MDPAHESNSPKSVDSIIQIPIPLKLISLQTLMEGNEGNRRDCRSVEATSEYDKDEGCPRPLTKSMSAPCLFACCTDPSKYHDIDYGDFSNNAKFKTARLRFPDGSSVVIPVMDISGESKSEEEVDDDMHSFEKEQTTSKEDDQTKASQKQTQDKIGLHSETRKSSAVLEKIVENPTRFQDLLLRHENNINVSERTGIETDKRINVTKPATLDTLKLTTYNDGKPESEKEFRVKESLTPGTRTIIGSAEAGGHFYEKEGLQLTRVLRENEPDNQKLNAETHNPNNPCYVQEDMSLSKIRRTDECTWEQVDGLQISRCPKQSRNKVISLDPNPFGNELRSYLTSYKSNEFSSNVNAKTGGIGQHSGGYLASEKDTQIVPPSRETSSSTEVIPLTVESWSERRIERVPTKDPISLKEQHQPTVDKQGFRPPEKKQRHSIHPSSSLAYSLGQGPQNQHGIVPQLNSAGLRINDVNQINTTTAQFYPQYQHPHWGMGPTKYSCAQQQHRLSAYGIPPRIPSTSEPWSPPVRAFQPTPRQVPLPVRFPRGMNENRMPQPNQAQFQQRQPNEYIVRRPIPRPLLHPGYEDAYSARFRYYFEMYERHGLDWARLSEYHEKYNMYPWEAPPSENCYSQAGWSNPNQQDENYQQQKYNFAEGLQPNDPFRHGGSITRGIPASSYVNGRIQQLMGTTPPQTSPPQQQQGVRYHQHQRPPFQSHAYGAPNQAKAHQGQVMGMAGTQIIRGQATGGYNQIAQAAAAVVSSNSDQTYLNSNLASVLISNANHGHELDKRREDLSSGTPSKYPNELSRQYFEPSLESNYHASRGLVQNNTRNHGITIAQQSHIPVRTPQSSPSRGEAGQNQYSQIIGNHQPDQLSPGQAKPYNMLPTPQYTSVIRKVRPEATANIQATLRNHIVPEPELQASSSSAFPTIPKSNVAPVKIDRRRILKPRKIISSKANKPCDPEYHPMIVSSPVPYLPPQEEPFPDYELQLRENLNSNDAQVPPPNTKQDSTGNLQYEHIVLLNKRSKTYMCKRCFETMKTEQEIKDHAFCKVSQKSIKCPICLQPTLSEEYAAHMLRIHGICNASENKSLDDGENKE